MGGLIFLILTVLLAVAGIWVMAKGKAVIPPTSSEINAANRVGRKRPDDKIVRIRWIGVLLLGISVLLLALNTMTTVPTRTVAVTTAFGKPTGTIRNGFHLIAPWETTNEFSTSLQTLKLSGDGDDNGEPISVRLASGATARVDVTVQWQIDPNANITDLFQDYREFSKLDKDVVRRKLSSTANSVFEKYDPLASLRGESQPISLGELALETKNQLIAQMPVGIAVRDVQISKIDFDETTQSKINALQAAIADTQIAEQRQKTAEAQKRANDLLASGNTTPGVLYQNCLDMVERMSKEGKTLPAAFTCGVSTPTVVSVK